MYGDKKTADAMKEEQLERTMFCNLDFIDFGGSNFNISFRPKDIVKMLKPVWPDWL